MADERPPVDPLREATQDILASFDRRDGWVLEHDSEETDVLRAALASPAVPPEGLDETALDDTLYRLREPFGYRTSWPGGKRWTVTDGSGFDDDVVAVFDTEAEAAAAVKVANGVREDALRIAATVPAAPRPEGLDVERLARALPDWIGDTENGHIDLHRLAEQIAVTYLSDTGDTP